MKSLRVLSIVTALSALVALPSLALAQRVITGELVAEGPSQFRIVGQGSGFKAPAGAPIQALDGKNVQVEISSSGQVTSITEAPVAINPVSHGWSTVRGLLKVTDPMNRRFTFANDTQAYVAPESISIEAYDGKMVEVKLDQNSTVTEIKLIGPGPQSAYPVPPVDGSCMYEGQTYSAGSAVCQSGTQYRCDGIRWQSLGSTCQVADARNVRAVPPHEPRSCSVGDATVAPGSAICRSGTTYRCDDGSWINVQTPCR
jgi:hypothetical protein